MWLVFTVAQVWICKCAAEKLSVMSSRQTSPQPSHSPTCLTGKSSVAEKKQEGRDRGFQTGCLSWWTFTTATVHHSHKTKPAIIQASHSSSAVFVNIHPSSIPSATFDAVNSFLPTNNQYDYYTAAVVYYIYLGANSNKQDTHIIQCSDKDFFSTRKWFRSDNFFILHKPNMSKPACGPMWK